VGTSECGWSQPNCRCGHRNCHCHGCIDRARACQEHPCEQPAATDPAESTGTTARAGVPRMAGVGTPAATSRADKPTISRGPPLVPGTRQQAERLASRSPSPGGPAYQRTRSLVAQSCQYSGSIRYGNQAAGTSMTGDPEPIPQQGSNTWPTKPAVPERPVRAGQQNWSSPAASRQTTSHPQQVWDGRSATTATDVARARSEQAYSLQGHSQRADSSAGLSSTAHHSLIWLSLMLVALTVLLLSFALWDPPETHQQGGPQQAVSSQDHSR